MLKRNKMQENKRKGQLKGQKLPKGQNSEGTFPKRLISKGQKKEGEEKNSSSTQAKQGEERKVL